jgi:exonuclease III
MTLLTYKISTLNINGIYSTNRTEILEVFLLINEIDVLCMQEVTNAKVTIIRNYTAHVNIRIEGRGTVILHKDCYHLTDIEKLPAGRGISGLFIEVKIISGYAPSGSARKGEREEFFNIIFPQLLRHPHPKLILAGDFNCVLQPTDTTGTFNTSRALKHLVQV